MIDIGVICTFILHLIHKALEKIYTKMIDINLY